MMRSPPSKPRAPHVARVKFYMYDAPLCRERKLRSGIFTLGLCIGWKSMGSPSPLSIWRTLPEADPRRGRMLTKRWVVHDDGDDPAVALRVSCGRLVDWGVSAVRFVGRPSTRSRATRAVGGRRWCSGWEEISVAVFDGQ